MPITSVGRFPASSRALFAFIAEAKLFQFGERLVGSVATLLLGCIDELVKVTAKEIGDAVLGSAVFAHQIARIGANADRITFLLAGRAQDRFTDIGVAYIGRIIEHTRQRLDDFPLVIGGNNIWSRLRLFAARRTGRKRNGKAQRQTHACRASAHRMSPRHRDCGQSSLSLRRRCPSVRSRSALSLMKPSASFWS